MNGFLLWGDLSLVSRGLVKRYKTYAWKCASLSNTSRTRFFFLSLLDWWRIEGKLLKWKRYDALWLSIGRTDCWFHFEIFQGDQSWPKINDLGDRERMEYFTASVLRYQVLKLLTLFTKFFNEHALVKIAFDLDVQRSRLYLWPTGSLRFILVQQKELKSILSLFLTNPGSHTGRLESWFKIHHFAFK